MVKQRLVLSCRLFLGLLLVGMSSCAKSPPLQPPYQESWESLASYPEAAEWFKDAKFGIYAHWGVLSVPAYANDWYPRNMHIEGTDEYNHHLLTYGHPATFGYHDFIPKFKAEYFDAKKWAQLFKASGAKFAGIVAEHHDGWSNWDSDINPWNSMDMGPKRDILGELSIAIKEEDLKLVTTFHIARNLQLYQQDSTQWLNDTSYFPFNPEMPTSSESVLLAKLYGNIPPAQFAADWLGQITEVIDNYSPDLIYFDGQTHKIPDSIRRKFLAYYFNDAFAKTKQVVVTHKEGEFPTSVSLQDFEKGRMNHITKEYWLTDETIAVGSWSYTHDLKLKSADEIIDILADVVSKNGALMLNISPMANGLIPENQQAVLHEIGGWLLTNGEAIYGTRPFITFGEGPTIQKRSGMFIEQLHYTAQDIRYTRKGSTIYAIALGWPGENKSITLNAFAASSSNTKFPRAKKLSILGHQGELSFSQDESGLHFSTPAFPLDEKAFVVKIETAPIVIEQKSSF